MDKRTEYRTPRGAETRPPRGAETRPPEGAVYRTPSRPPKPGAKARARATPDGS